MQPSLLLQGFRPEARKQAPDTVVLHCASAIRWETSDDKFNADFRARFHAENHKLALWPPEKRTFSPDHVRAIFQAYDVSAHYLIARDGTIHHLVEENKVAYHAGKSKMPEWVEKPPREGVNEFSLGIELIATLPDDDPRLKDRVPLGLDPEDLHGPIPGYTYAQMHSLRWLLRDIRCRHKIRFIMGHDEIAPGRKSDPGPLFPWSVFRAPKSAEILPK
jgi:N-acetyl-anhydromuramyl-L-alanine amidase AmpD